MPRVHIMVFSAAAVLLAGIPAVATGQGNPFAKPSTLPFQAPPFDQIKDSDYQPAFEQGMREQLAEIEAIANDPAPPTFENTIVAMEKSGRMLDRVNEAFNAVVQANTNPTLDEVQAEETPRLAAHHDAIYMNPKLFARVKAIYDRAREAQARSGIADAAQGVLRRLRPRRRRPLRRRPGAAARDQQGGRHPRDRVRAEADRRHQGGSVRHRQALGPGGAERRRDRRGGTRRRESRTQGPVPDPAAEHHAAAAARVAHRPRRAPALFDNSWTRTERGDANDTRATIARLAELRAEKAKLLGYPNYAAYVLARPDGEDTAGRRQVPRPARCAHGRQGRRRGEADPGGHRQGRKAVHARSRGTGRCMPSRCGRRNTTSTRTS